MNLHSKRLQILWDQKTYGHETTRHQKPIDGIFIFQSLFSVAAFASRREQTLSTLLAQETTEILLTKLRDFRNSIIQKHQTLLQEMGSFEINIPKENEPQTLMFNPKHLTPENVMLMKVFLAYDDYFQTLNKAKVNGEVTPKEHQRFRKVAISELIALLNKLNVTCISFHQVRKQAESET